MMLATLALIGFALSVYAYCIEYRHARNPDYRAICDISRKASCTKAFTGRHGKILGVSNSVVGICFYAVVFIMANLGLVYLVFASAIAACVTSVFLAYVLYRIEKTVCIVCTSIYVVNILLLIFSYLAL